MSPIPGPGAPATINDTLDTLVGMMLDGGVDRVYKFGAVPPKAEYPYAVASLAFGAPDSRMLAGPGEPMGRFTVQFFGRTIDLLLECAAQATDTFEGRALALDGEPVAWQETATPPYRDPDTAGVLDITQTYRF